MCETRRCHVGLFRWRTSQRHQRPPGRRLEEELLLDELAAKPSDMKPCQPEAGLAFGAIRIRSACDVFRHRDVAIIDCEVAEQVASDGVVSERLPPYHADDVDAARPPDHQYKLLSLFGFNPLENQSRSTFPSSSGSRAMLMAISRLVLALLFSPR
jgi:hypothetical protein